MSSVVFPCKFPLFCISPPKLKPCFKSLPHQPLPLPLPLPSRLRSHYPCKPSGNGCRRKEWCRPTSAPSSLGLVAMRDVNKDEFLLKIPRRLWVNTDTVASSDIGSICRGLKPWVVVCLFPAREKEMGNSSPWSFYLDVLPERNDSTIFWSEEELFEIKGTSLLRMTMEMKEHVKGEFDKVGEAVITPNGQLFPSSLTFEKFLWAFGMISILAPR